MTNEIKPSDVLRQVIELQTEVRLIKENNSKTVKQFKRFAWTVIFLEIVNR